MNSHSMFLLDSKSIAALKSEREKLDNSINAIQKQIAEALASRSTVTREMGDLKRNVKQSILDETDVFCSTLSGSAQEIFSQLFEGRGAVRKVRVIIGLLV